jgi:hypothetical protein
MAKYRIIVSLKEVDTREEALEVREDVEYNLSGSNDNFDFQYAIKSIRVEKTKQGRKKEVYMVNEAKDEAPTEPEQPAVSEEYIAKFNNYFKAILKSRGFSSNQIDSAVESLEIVNSKLL